MSILALCLGCWAGSLPALAHFGEADDSAGSVETARDVVARAAELADRLDRDTGAGGLKPLREELRQLKERLGQLQLGDSDSGVDGQQLAARARMLLRRIAFRNPLLQMHKILFVKRHDAAGVYHMCDQYYGCNAKPGGGLFVLVDPLTDQPRVVNLLENSQVQNGRLKGRKLEGGSFLSPEVSFDGKTILFAYSEAKAWEKYQGQEAYEWKPEYSYHIFKCDADGGNLVQLTDGPWNDFDPCFLPNGRVAFISERRGGYLRCGRHCPVYTLHSMQADGSQITRLSHHETHEWNPSVAHDGRIVYTRWDYVDRDTNVAHHMWTCQPDGRDPRSLHGNYPQQRELRPWMEMRIRAVPGSPKFVASTVRHHGHEFGSLVLIDPRMEDDNAMSQLTRLTPGTPFPESEGGKANVRKFSAYGTPWPLSEDDYLCVYDPAATNRGIYWIDRWGNRELLYRDPQISCASPIPLRPRPRPPQLPEQIAHTQGVGLGAEAIPRATVGVVNVYDSDFAWPANTRITALRVVQVLPKTTPAPNVPRIGVAQQTNARAVLGTVPVEADGSVYFEAPVGKELYFQALDERGMAVQSMRSGTYLHPGQQLICQGCHEHKWRSPPRAAASPLAMQRRPSQIAPAMEGSNPFNYVRLVQNVLDRNCVDCHARQNALDLTNVVEGPHGWTRSYTNLAAEYGFYFDVTNGALHTGVRGGARTVPGKFGARASRLVNYLGRDHYGVQLSHEDHQRLVLWLDCNSEFYGAYEQPELQSLGVAVRPSID